MRPGWELRESEVTDESLYRARRQFMARAAGLLGGALLAPGTLLAACARPMLKAEPATPLEDIVAYNNYYEFSTNKKAIRILAQELTLRPWTLRIDGEVARPLELDIDDLLARFPEQERIYRMRCVEGWSMVIPWNGFPLCELLRLAEPNGHARYVEFIGLRRPEEMIGQRRSTFDWPYREGLRLDEAMHPLTFLATGLYGKSLPAQNGAPLRLVVPWKYGFKSIKAITRIRLRRDRPVGSWSRAAPSEYGFFANVNPEVPHPRWSQSREVRIGELRKRPTLPFNGYAEQVAHLYRGMDLRRNF